MNTKKRMMFFMFIALFLCIAILVIPGHMEGHDCIFHVARINAIAEGLKNKTFPVLIYPEYFDNYGYANGIFYPDFFLYFPALLVLVGVPLFTAYKLFLFVIVLASYCSFYFCCQKISRSEYLSSVISLIYSTSSYFLVDLYSRSAIGEAQAFVFFPLVIYGFYSIAYDDFKDGKFFTLGIVGIMMCHVLSAVICVILVLFMFIACIGAFFQDKKRFMHLILFGLFSIVMTAYITLPMLEMMASDFYVFADSDEIATIGRAVPLAYTILEISYHHLGLSTLYIPQGIGIVFVYLLALTGKYYKEQDNNFSSKMLIIGILFLFMSTNLFPWSFFYRYLNIIQFPWRFYICITVCLLFAFIIPLKGMFLKSSLKERIRFAAIICLFATFTVSITTYNLFEVCYNRSNDIKYEVMVGEYLPVDVDINKIDTRGEIITSNNNINIDFERKGTNLVINYKGNNHDSTYLELPLIYYKGYEACENGNSLNVEKGENGLVKIWLNNQQGTIKVKYGFTIYRKIGLAVSMFSIAAFCIYCKKNQKRNLIK